MAKLFLQDIGSPRGRTIEITHFSHDGELQFECFHGDYLHLNFTRDDVDKLHRFLGQCIGKESPKSYTMLRQQAEQTCTDASHNFWNYWHDNFNFCPICGKTLR